MRLPITHKPRTIGFCAVFLRKQGIGDLMMKEIAEDVSDAEKNRGFKNGPSTTHWKELGTR